MYSRSSISILPLIPLLLNTVLAEHTWQCYAPDGVTKADNASAYLPCINIPGVQSMCCATNRTGSDMDICDPTGLCLSGGTYFRDFCTDPTWESPNCLPKTVCDDAAGGSSNGTPSLTHCADGTWCCNGNNQSCCTNHLGFQLPATLLTVVPGPGNAKAAATSSFNSTSSAPSSSSSSTVKVVDNSKVTAVGVGVGVSLGVIAIVGTIAGFWFGQKRGESLASKRLVSAGVGGGVGHHPVPVSELQNGKHDYQPVVGEMASTGAVHEVPATRY